jgi:hypothetical protein
MEAAEPKETKRNGKLKRLDSTRINNDKGPHKEEAPRKRKEKKVGDQLWGEAQFIFCARKMPGQCRGRF